jgi:CheY-like chemotaxis protein
MIELATIFDKAAGPRLGEAEKLILNWPSLFPVGLSSCDLFFRLTTRSLFAIARFDEKRFGPDTEQRFQFWASQSGGRALSTYQLRDAERAIFHRQLSQCEVHEKGLSPDKLPEAFLRLSGRIGAGDRRSPRVAMELEVDLGTRGGLVVTQDVSAGGVFVLSTVAPPLGDRFKMKLKLPDREKPFELDVKVAHARMQTGRGGPMGFGVQFLAPPPELTGALSAYFEAKKAQTKLETRRTSIRHEVNAPVRIIPVEPVVPGVYLRPTGPPATPPAPVSVTYNNAADAQADYVKNLSHGGAFIQSASPLPLHTKVMLDFAFPKGLSLRVVGTVVHSQPGGMGVQFNLDAAAKTELSTIIAALTEVPRRALVVEQDPELRAKLCSALTTRGFATLEASSAEEGLHVLLEELLNLDAVLCRQSLPPLGTLSLVDVIRQAGGESDLLLVLINDEGPKPSSPVDAQLPLSAGPQKIAQQVFDVWQARRRAS